MFSRLWMWFQVVFGDNKLSQEQAAVHCDGRLHVLELSGGPYIRDTSTLAQPLTGRLTVIWAFRQLHVSILYGVSTTWWTQCVLVLQDREGSHQTHPARRKLWCLREKEWLTYSLLLLHSIQFKLNALENGECILKTLWIVRSYGWPILLLKKCCLQVLWIALRSET